MLAEFPVPVSAVSSLASSVGAISDNGETALGESDGSAASTTAFYPLLTLEPLANGFYTPLTRGEAI